MADGSTLSVLSGALISDGVQFLYARAGELLNWLRARKSAGAQSQSEPVPAPAVGPVGSAVLDGPLDTRRIDQGALEQLAAVIASGRGVLSPYAEGFIPVEAGDSTLLSAMGRVRRALEGVYGQTITFEGERGRGRTGAVLDVRMVLDDIYGEVTGGKIGRLHEGEVTIDVHGRDVKPGATVIGGQIEEMGRPSGDTR